MRCNHLSKIEYKDLFTVMNDHQIAFLAGTHSYIEALDVLERKGIRITPVRSLPKREITQLKKLGLID